MEIEKRKNDFIIPFLRLKLRENKIYEQENYNSKKEDLEEEDQREDERNVIL